MQKIQQQLSAGSNGANLHKEARTKTHGSNYWYSSRAILTTKYLYKFCYMVGSPRC